MQTKSVDICAFPVQFRPSDNSKANSSPSPPERYPARPSNIPRYEPEEINEYEDDVPYYEDDPIHYPSSNAGGQSQHPVGYDILSPKFKAPQYPPVGEQSRLRRLDEAHLSSAPPQPFRAPTSQMQRRQPQYPPNFPQQEHENTFSPPGPSRGSNPRNSSGIRLRPVSELRTTYYP
jgi:hypothetical protein